MDELRGLVPSKIIENLLKKAIELDEAELCLSFVDNVQILEESHAVDCLKYFLKDQHESAVNSEFDTDLEKKLDSIFRKKFDYRLLTGQVKRLSSNEFIICLQYLQDYLRASFQTRMLIQQSTSDQEPSSQSQSSTQRPSILQITDLFCCFVDAHFTHITLSTRAQEIIADVLQSIENQLDSFMDLISVESLVEEIKDKNSEFQNKNNNKIGHYYVEVLKLK
jgi:hypothetical protein